MKLIEKLKSWSEPRGGFIYLCVAAIVFFLPYERILTLHLPIFPGGYTLRLSHIAALLLIGAFGYRIYRLRRWPKLNGVDFALLAFLFVYLLSAVQANDLKRSLAVWLFTVFVAITAFVLSRVVKKDWLEKLEPILRFTVWIVIIFGFYQYFADTLGVSTAFTGLRDMYTRTALGFPRIQSFGLEPLYYANFLQIPLFIYAARYIFAKKSHPALILCILVQILLSVSRGAIMATIAGVIIMLGVSIIFFRNKLDWLRTVKFIGIVLLAVALSYALVFLSGAIAERISFNKLPNQSATSRTESTFKQATNLDLQDDRERNRTLAISAWRTRPIFGIGPGNFGHYAIAQYEGYRGSSGYIIVNNEPLELLAESGLIGITAFSIFALLLLWRASKIVYQTQLSDGLSIFMLSLLVYLAALVIQYQTFSTLYIMHIWVVIGMLMASILLATPKIHKR